MENFLDSGVEIIVKNAEGDLDTKATIIHQNNIDYEPKVSVIIPVYNTEEYLRECLDSVVNQTLKEIEIICVDDGSTDSSLEILKEYASKDNRFTIITQENLHAGVARNAGLSVAQGKYLHFLDSDDEIFDKYFYQTTFNLAKKNKNINVIHFCAKAFDINKKEWVKRADYEQLNIPPKYINTILKYNEAMDIIRNFSVVPWLNIIKRDFLNKKKIKFSNLKCCNDRAFFVKITQLSDKIYNFNITGVKHHVGDQNSLISLRKNNFECMFQNYAMIKNFLSLKKIKSNIAKKVLINELKDMCYWYNKYKFDEASIIENMKEFVNKIDLEYLLPELQLETFYFDLLELRDTNNFPFKNNITLSIDETKQINKLKDFLQKIFSVKNRESRDNKWYKVITILGIKFKFKSKDLTQRKNLIRLYDKIQEQDFQFKKQFCKLEELSNKFLILKQENDTRKEEIIKLGNINNEFKRNISDLKKCSANQRKEINEMKCKYNGVLKRLTPQTTLRSFVYHLADHCNLKCRGCDHFSPLANAKLANVDEFEKDVKRLSELTKQELEIIKLMGGEPLLHPDITQFMQIARNNFPNTRIEIVTNGILLNQQNEYFWNACKEFDVTIVPTKYPLNIDYDKAKETAKSYGVKYEYYNNNEDILKTSYHIPLDIEGKQNAVENFTKCFHANWCVMLKNGKLYTCTVAPNIEHFNKYFGYSIPLSERDGIDIHKAESIDEILEFLARPIPFCKYCNVNGRTFKHEWGTSTKDISEWV